MCRFIGALVPTLCWMMLTALHGVSAYDLGHHFDCATQAASVAGLGSDAALVFGYASMLPDAFRYYGAPSFVDEDLLSHGLFLDRYDEQSIEATWQTLYENVKQFVQDHSHVPYWKANWSEAVYKEKANAAYIRWLIGIGVAASVSQEFYCNSNWAEVHSQGDCEVCFDSSTWWSSVPSPEGKGGNRVYTACSSDNDKPCLHAYEDVDDRICGKGLNHNSRQKIDYEQSFVHAAIGTLDLLYTAKEWTNDKDFYFWPDMASLSLTETQRDAFLGEIQVLRYVSSSHQEFDSDGYPLVDGKWKGPGSGSCDHPLWLHSFARLWPTQSHGHASSGRSILYQHARKVWNLPLKDLGDPQSRHRPVGTFSSLSSSQAPTTGANVARSRSWTVQNDGGEMEEVRVVTWRELAHPSDGTYPQASELSVLSLRVVEASFTTPGRFRFELRDGKGNVYTEAALPQIQHTYPLWGFVMLVDASNSEQLVTARVVRESSALDECFDGGDKDVPCDITAERMTETETVVDINSAGEEEGRIVSAYVQLDGSNQGAFIGTCRPVEWDSMRQVVDEHHYYNEGPGEVYDHCDCQRYHPVQCPAFSSKTESFYFDVWSGDALKEDVAAGYDGRKLSVVRAAEHPNPRARNTEKNRKGVGSRKSSRQTSHHHNHDSKSIDSAEIAIYSKFRKLPPPGGCTVSPRVCEGGGDGVGGGGDDGARGSCTKLLDELTSCRSKYLWAGGVYMVPSCSSQGRSDARKRGGVSHKTPYPPTTVSPPTHQGEAQQQQDSSTPQTTDESTFVTLPNCGEECLRIMASTLNLTASQITSIVTSGSLLSSWDASRDFSWVNTERGSGSDDGEEDIPAEHRSGGGAIKGDALLVTVAAALVFVVGAGAVMVRWRRSSGNMRPKVMVTTQR